MKKNKIVDSIKNTMIGFCMLALMGCGGFGNIVKMPEIKEVPTGTYEHIIKLNNPAAVSDKAFAGLIFIKKGASVCTDYPRQEIIKSLNELTMMERNSCLFFSNYAIASGGKTFGFVSVPVEYTVMLWENEKDEDCKYKVQITWLGEKNSNTGEERHNAGSGGGHGR